MTAVFNLECTTAIRYTLFQHKSPASYRLALVVSKRPIWNKRFG